MNFQNGRKILTFGCPTHNHNSMRHACVAGLWL